jgi:tetratricopeptide (TPR) repeat protein
MKRFVQGFLSLLMLGTAHAASFEEAAYLAKQGDWDTAILNYETLLKEGGPSASVYYNLGLSYQQKADHGRAVLAYERALAMSPRAVDARNNLTKLREQASLPAVSTLPERMPAFTAWLSRGEWTFVFLLGLVLLVSGVWVCTFTSQKKSRIISIIALIISTVMIASSTWVTSVRKSEDQWAVVLSSDQSLLLSPFDSAEKITPCPAGSLIRIESENDDYVYARLSSDETRGWLRRDSLERITAP